LPPDSGDAAEGGGDDDGLASGLASGLGGLSGLAAGLGEALFSTAPAFPAPPGAFGEGSTRQPASSDVESARARARCRYDIRVLFRKC
jgi:hypothetical protein